MPIAIYGKAQNRIKFSTTCSFSVENYVNTFNLHCILDSVPLPIPVTAEELDSTYLCWTWYTCKWQPTLL